MSIPAPVAGVLWDNDIGGWLCLADNGIRRDQPGAIPVRPQGGLESPRDASFHGVLNEGQRRLGLNGRDRSVAKGV